VRTVDAKGRVARGIKISRSCGIFASGSWHLWLLVCHACLMAFVPLVLTIPNTLTFGEEKRLRFCEGAYSRISETGSSSPKETKLDEWRLYKLTDGNYSLEIEQADSRGRERIVERRTLSSDLRPIAFDIELVSRSQPEDVRLKIECKFSSVQVQCNANDVVGKMSATDTIQQKMPYAFLPIMGPFPVDLAWTSQMYLAQVDHTEGEKVVVPVVGFAEGENRSSLKLVSEDGDEVEYMGRESLERLNQKIVAHKFRLRSATSPDDPESTSFAWLSQSGLLIQLAHKDGPFLVLSAYHGPPL
jgi:hypothetical protein